MAIFTDSIMEIIQRNAGNTDITTIDGIYQVGAPIFFGSEMNVISPEYRERFEKGFLLKFFNDELAFDAFPMWRIKFQEKIFNNGDYINQIYDTLDRQIFSDYKVRKRNAQEASRMVTDVNGNSVSQTDGKVATANSGVTNEVNSNTNTLGEQRRDSSAGSVEGKGTITDSKTGSEVLNGTGAVVNQRSGSDTNNLTGTDEITRQGNRVNDRETVDRVDFVGTETDRANRTLADSLQKLGYDERVMSDDSTAEREGSLSLHTGGSDVRENTLTKTGKDKIRDDYHSWAGQEGKLTDERTQSGEVNDNAFQVTYGAPAGSLQHMRSPGGSSKGTGSGLISSESFNYWDSALEDGSTRSYNNYKDKNERTASNDYKQTKNGYDTREASFEDRTDTVNDTTNYGRTQAQSQTENSEAHRDGTDTMNYNSQAVTARTGKDEMTHSFNGRSNIRGVTDTDTNSYGESNLNEKNLNSTTNYNSQDTQARNVQDEKIYDTDITRERDTLDISSNNSVGSRDVSSQDNGTRNIQDNSASTTDEDTRVEKNDTSNTDAVGSKTNVEDETDYNVSLEMIYRSVPLLGKVWEIFNDLFMLILE